MKFQNVFGAEWTILDLQNISELERSDKLRCTGTAYLDSGTQPSVTWEIRWVGGRLGWAIQIHTGLNYPN